MEDSEIVVSGPEFTGTEYWGSIGEFLIPKLKSHPKDFIIQVDCATGETITSHEFLQRSIETAEGLIEFGIKLGDVVVFACSNNIRGHTAAIGTILSGAVFAPIDQTLRSYELQHLFKDFQPKLIICESEKAKEMESSVKTLNIDCKILTIDSTDTTGEFFSWKDINTKVDVDNYVPRTVPDPKKSIAIISCSSGSTGMPKGVALSHYALMYSIATIESMNLNTTNNFLFIPPLFWISGSTMLINSCYFGHTRSVPKSSSVEDILDAIENCKTDFLLAPPSTILSLVEHENFVKRDVSSVKILFIAGATLGSTVSSIILENWKEVVVCNCYGLTETSMPMSFSFDRKNPDAIGKLSPGVKVKVVDVNTGKSLGPNNIGECRVKTKRIMNGYYNDEKATNAAFDENGWLSTGDLVYYNEEGVFYFVSRMKEIIPYLNYKITPVEIESFIIGLPGVKDVAVVGVPHETDTNHLRALVVKHPNSDVTAEYIIQRVKENFTDRKHLKEGVQFVESLPRTTVGKLKRLEVQKLIEIKK